MQTRFVAALVLVAASAIAAPAFASGYGPAPFYRPSVGAPESQRGQSTQTIVAGLQPDVDTQRAYGGMDAGFAQSGHREAVAPQSGVYAHH